MCVKSEINMENPVIVTRKFLTDQLEGWTNGYGKGGKSNKLFYIIIVLINSRVVYSCFEISRAFQIFQWHIVPRGECGMTQLFTPFYRWVDCGRIVHNSLCFYFPIVLPLIIAAPV